ncbi:hypothetical protein I4F81_006906 [Pyropia yezoensis]|uniref:Uncharacterized protein n=1 Tax=Pyropia yezoensis TaxID=2788 RepID=A0ACC3C3C8_PYRYE|nr:hypothetical protein I4F81_006906 [Neopyropia yezoensis]
MEAVADQLSGLAVNGGRPREGAGSPESDACPFPRRPLPGERNVLVTSALPYCNNVPHLGNLIGAVLSADVYARYLRQRGVNVVYVCGTDEYGTATENKAQAEGVSPRTICDRYTALHKSVYDWFDIRFDHFGRTSTPSQTAIVHEMFWALHGAGLVFPDDVHQLYCAATCNRPLSDRYVVGTCPRCGYEDARGDQCDSCSELLNPAELLRPRCATCGKTPETRASRHLFLDLPALASAVEGWSKDTQAGGGIWSANAVAMTRTWLRDGLEPRCITRDLDWGVPVPLEGFTDKVFYVWFDAPIGYLSITAEYAPDHWREWWEAGDRPPLPPTPSSLGSRRPWTMVQHLSTTEYLQYESGKFSKSRGVGVFGTDARDTNIAPAVWRYYLLVNRPEAADATFTWADLRAKNNDELLNNVGNFMHRTATFLASSFDAVMPELNGTVAAVVDATATINGELAAYHEAFAGLSLKAALKRAMAVARLGNQFLQTAQPWHSVKTDRKAAGSALAFSASVVVLLAGLLEPFLGQGWSTAALARLGVDRTDAVVCLADTFSPPLLPAGHRTAAKPTPLFSLISAADAEGFRSRFGGAPAAGAAAGAAAAAPAATGAFVLDLRVGRVATVEPHGESDRLYVATVDVGETAPDGTPSTRTLVAGLRDAYTADDLLGRPVVVACNMAPATLAGVQSQAMILAAEKKKPPGDAAARADGEAAARPGG